MSNVSGSAGAKARPVQVRFTMSGAAWYSADGRGWYASELAAWAAYLTAAGRALCGEWSA